MTDLEKAKALIALSELTYMENYYGKDLDLFSRDKTSSSNDTSGESDLTTQGK